MAPRLDRYDLYELCVQAPDRDAAVIDAIHGHSPAVLGEDFCGTAAVSRHWVTLPHPRQLERTAIAVDNDPEPLARAEAEGVTIRRADVMEVDEAADAIFVGNFSIGEFRDRPALLNYLKHVRERLTPGGIFLCDIYGGADAHACGTLEDELQAPGGEHVRYLWEQRAANPLTAEVVDALHFEVTPPDGEPYELADAFVYHWRLWTAAELREAMFDAGFDAVEIYDRVDHALDDEGVVHVLPLAEHDEVGESFTIFIVGRLTNGWPA